MNFDIKDALLERVVALAEKLSIKVSTAAHRVFVAGIDALDKTPNATPDNEPHLDHHAPSALTDEQKEFVRTHIATMNNQQIAAKLQCTVTEVMQEKDEILRAFIRANWEQKSDGDMARELGCSRAIISTLRLRLGLKREKGGRNRKITALVTKEELEKALTEDGLTLEAFACKQGIGVTRERIRQLADQLGVSQKRKPLWYATKWGKPELGNKDYVEKMLAEKESVSAFAKFVGLPDNAAGVSKIKKICGMHGIALLPPKNPRDQGNTELQCHQCGASFILKRSRLNQLKKKGVKRHFCGRKCFLQWAKDPNRNETFRHGHTG